MEPGPALGWDELPVEVDDLAVVHDDDLVEPVEDRLAEVVDVARACRTRNVTSTLTGPLWRGRIRR